MADIQSKVLSKYEIDISKENIFKLYKIEELNLTTQEIEIKIEETRKRWRTSINGANEKNAERDRGRLEKANQYEAILRDSKLRKEVYNFYQKSSSDGNSSSSSTDGRATAFAKEYFELVATTKKVKETDVDFFFKYYQAERKNKKAILEMLNKEMRIMGLGKEDKYADEKDSVDVEGVKKDDSTPLIVNLFQEATLLKMRRAIEKYEEAILSAELRQKYPKLEDGLYEYLDIEDVEDAKQFTEAMAQKGKEVYAVRQERGTEYVPLVDLFNILQSIGGYQDVSDNIVPFKILLKYPNLTPYMFSFIEMKPSTVKGIVNVAKRDYAFRDDTDFLLNYYKPVHDNFGISDSGISSVLRKAEKKAKANKVLKDIDKKLGRKAKKKAIPIGAEVIHWLLYWPIFMLYFVFEIAKLIFMQLHRFAFPLSIGVFLLQSWLMPKRGMDNLWVLRKVFFKNEWLAYLDEFIGDPISNGFELLILSIITIIVLLAVYILPSLFTYYIVLEFSSNFNKDFDWKGIERTFEQIFITLKKKTVDQYQTQKSLFFKNKLPKIAINTVCLISVVVAIYFTPMGLSLLSERSGNGMPLTNEVPDTLAQEIVNDQEEITMVITQSLANIRSGPGTDNEILQTTNQGDVFIATGNQETTSNGRIWYEIYLDEIRSQIGWASEKVISFNNEDL